MENLGLTLRVDNRDAQGTLHAEIIRDDSRAQRMRRCSHVNMSSGGNGCEIRNP